MSATFNDKGLVFGHRGVPWEAPQNTLAGFRRACELGLAGVELDAQLCQTGEAVVIHDFTVNGTTDGTGRVNELPFAALRELSAGRWFHERFASERIPTLSEVFEATAPDLLINVELKTETFGTDGLEARVAELIRKHGAGNRVLVSSFNPFALIRFRRVMPEIPIGMLYAPDLALYLRRTWFAPMLRPEAVHPNFEMLTPAGMRFARRRAPLLNTWTVNDVTEMRRLLDAGLNAIISDEPAVLQAVAAGTPPPPPMEMVFKRARKAAA